MCLTFCLKAYIVIKTRVTRQDCAFYKKEKTNRVHVHCIYTKQCEIWAMNHWIILYHKLKLGRHNGKGIMHDALKLVLHLQLYVMLFLQGLNYSVFCSNLHPFFFKLRLGDVPKALNFVLHMLEQCRLKAIVGCLLSNFCTICKVTKLQYRASSQCSHLAWHL